MRNKSFLKILIIPFIVFLSFLAHADSKYSDVFIFGDSLSDTGNLASVSNLLQPPYYQFRASNGPLAVETLANKLGDTADASLHLLQLNEGPNYAVAGATAYGDEPSDLDTQVQAFTINNNFIAPKDALYVIFIGGNDIRTALYEPDSVIADTVIKTAKNKIRNAIMSLKQMGASSFYVIGAPDIGDIPETTLMATALNNPELITRAHSLSKKFNKKIHHMVKQVESHSDIEITEFKLAELFSKVIANADELGFTNTTDACFSTFTLSFHPDCNFGLNADKFIFFDEIHPTARVHEMFGEAFFKKLAI